MNVEAGHGDYQERKLQQRPETGLLETLRSIPVSLMSDCLKRMEVRSTQVIGPKPIGPVREHLAGPLSVVGAAITIDFAPDPDTSLARHMDAPYKLGMAIDEAQPGDVIVISGHGAPYGFWGGHTTTQALKLGVSGVVIDGYVRDVSEIRPTGFPVFAAGITFESYVRRYEPVGFNVPVTVGKSQVRPGDVIAGDDDGVLVIPREVLAGLVAVVQEVGDLEQDLLAAAKGKGSMEEIYRTIHWKKYFDPARHSLNE
jgi:regulator of RNase E activity RraA